MHKQATTINKPALTADNTSQSQSLTKKQAIKTKSELRRLGGMPGENGERPRSSDGSSGGDLKQNAAPRRTMMMGWGGSGRHGGCNGGCGGGEGDHQAEDQEQGEVTGSQQQKMRDFSVERRCITG